MGSPQAATTTALKGSQRLGQYLRRLRSGYGYSLRRVEERARAEGGEIDNSQLSRYEKGICYPSFDKLRVLASVFNVSIQSFSDVVELEAYENLKPREGDADALLQQGCEASKAGDNGMAFACFESALDQLTLADDKASHAEKIGELRVHQAVALRRLGKLALAEQELRNALRHAEHLSPRLRTRAVLSLAGIHADRGERFLAELEAERAQQLAADAGLDRMGAMALHTLAHMLSEQGRHEDAVVRSREAARLYAQCGEDYEAIRVRINIGIYYVALGKVREGIRLLHATLQETRKGHHRRLEALVWAALGEAYYRVEDPMRARRCFRESDALAVYNNEKQPDILFHNAFYEWQMADRDDNPTRAKIAFGRLKALRSSLERRFPEVEKFDEFVERGRAHA